MKPPVIKPTTFSEKELFIIASSWTYGWKHLAEALKVSSANLPDQSQEASKALLKRWLDESTASDKRNKLAELFQEEGYPSVAEEVSNIATCQ